MTPQDITRTNVRRPDRFGSRKNSSLWHLMTCGYPPQVGGVSDYTYGIAAGLAAQGDEVHVWCPACPGPQPQAEGVIVHRELGTITPPDLRRVGRQLDQFPGQRQLLVQWVPHGYGNRSMNLPFCAWLWARSALRRDQVELMVHEPFLAFGEGCWRQNVAAVVHRLMAIMLLQAADRVWVSIPAWEPLLRPWALGRRISFEWLPVPSNVPVDHNLAETTRIRGRYLGEQRILTGHFGTHGTAFLEKVVQGLLTAHPQTALLLMGRASALFRDKLEQQFPELGGRLHASGVLDPMDLSHHLSACDLMLQPYPDGVSSRRSSIMSALAHALPAVTTTGRLSENLWLDSGAVAAAPVGDTDAFVAEASRLLADSEARISLGKCARALYEERFEIGHVVATLRKVRQTSCPCGS